MSCRFRRLSRSILIRISKSDKFVKKYGRLGRSWGCPALSKESNKEVIDRIKNGSVLFIYSHDKKYLNTSRWLSVKKDFKRTLE
ncbi:MAG: hypothetical protein GY940_38350 [bacterium]|nr:hypothetical protein [bacterium]